MDEIIILDSDESRETPAVIIEETEPVEEITLKTVDTFIVEDLPKSFLVGFCAGLLIVGLVYAIRAVSRLFVRAIGEN